MRYFISGSGGGGGAGRNRAAAAPARGGIRGLFGRAVQGARNIFNRLRGA